MFADFPRFVVLVWFLDHFWRISAHLPDCAMQLKQTEAGTSLYLGRIFKLFRQNLNQNVSVHIFWVRPQKYDEIFHFYLTLLCRFQKSMEISSCFCDLLWIVEKNIELGITTVQGLFTKIKKLTNITIFSILLKVRQF